MANQVCRTDITYIPMKEGFMYPTAVIDFYSRKILTRRISNTMDAEWCKQVRADAVNRFGKPEIGNPIRETSI